MNIREWIPIISWLGNYDKRNLGSDITAGLTVGVMAIPQGMAYGMLAGLPPIYGLYTSLVPVFIYALFGTSRHLVIGPAAMGSFLVAAGVSVLAIPGTPEYIQLALLLTLFVAVVQFLLGVFKMGFLLNYLSQPVLSGFISAAALIIFFSQLKHFTGIDIPRSHHIHDVIIHAIRHISELNMPTFILGLCSTAIILIIRKFRRSIPGALIAVIFGIIAIYFFKFNELGVKIIGSVPEGLPKFSIPNFDLETVIPLLPSTFTIALIGILSSLALGKAMQTKHKNYDISANQEMRALGLANFFGSFFSSIPAAGSFSRTAVNDQAGAKTALSSIVAVILIGLTLLFLTPLFYYLPNSILASIIMVAIVSLVDIKEAKYLWYANKKDFSLLIITFLATLFWGIEQGILVGISLSLLIVTYESTRPHISILGRVPNTNYYKDLARFEELEDREDVLIIRFSGKLYFANAAGFKDKLTKAAKEKGDALELIIINAKSITDIDSTAIHTLQDIYRYYKNEGIDVCYSGMIGPVRDAFHRGGLLSLIGETHFHMNIKAAINAFDKNESGILKRYNTQTNVKSSDKPN